MATDNQLLIFEDVSAHYSGNRAKFDIRRANNRWIGNIRWNSYRKQYTVAQGNFLDWTAWELSQILDKVKELNGA